MPINGKNKDMVLNQIIESLKRLVEVAYNGALVGVKRRLNFIAGENVTLTVADNPTGKSVDITVAVPTASTLLPDGDKGDITVSGSGAVWNIDAGAVGDAELRDSAANSVIGRASNTVGDPADIVAAVDDLPLRRNAGTLAFGAIPESSVTNLVSDLAGKVPTTRVLTASAPITGGGDLSADRSFGLDPSALLDNNARLKVYKNSVAVGVRRSINFIEGTNITLTVTDDNPDEEVEVTIDASGGGGSGLTHPQVMSRVFLR
jgi:hypothetical protein